MEIPQPILDAILNALEAGNDDALRDAAGELRDFVTPPTGTGIIGSGLLSSPSNTRQVGLKFVFRCIPRDRAGVVIPSSVRQKFQRKARAFQADGSELEVGKFQDSGGTDVYFYCYPTVNGLLRPDYQIRENSTTDWVRALKGDGTTTWEVPS
jgi:hypothetical protein